ncbi:MULTISPECIES: hypothetical protein [Paraburkholderia]|uniref:hypothetical protein n=1 Tax=Paraburkholderia TaxID=1822464 RepID=UPI0005A7F000|nr:hypothetical protein [Paraburkholderia ferrariae]
MKRVKRFAEYDGWKIEASPIILAKQRLFQAGAVIEHADGVRFVFSDLGNRAYRWQAYERGIEWAKQWIDINYRYGTVGRSSCENVR